jgi:hypothetical protein
MVLSHGTVHHTLFFFEPVSGNVLESEGSEIDV